MSNSISHLPNNSPSSHHPKSDSSFKQGIVDAHAHFWDLSRLEYPWLDEVPAIKRDYFPKDYTDQIKDIPVAEIVFVQSDCASEQSLKEVEFVSRLALQETRIKGIVAHNPIDNIHRAIKELDILKTNPLVKGIRCMFKDSGRFLSSHAIDVLKILPSYNYPFDICIQFNDLPNIIKMIEQCPDTCFIIDHLAKPVIDESQFEEFQQGMDVLASFPNVFAKISGLITEAGPHWSTEQLKPYITYAIEAFGHHRLMFGSNWPVLLLNGTLNNWYEMVDSFTHSYSDDERSQLFRKTAEVVYRLK